jgi:pyridoxal phosphate enzyme (YggS family)
MERIKDNLERVKERMAEAALRSGRSPDSVRLVAVSKTVEADRIREAIEAGVKILGENRVQEAERKISLLGRDVEWHLVGHLQTNKAKVAVSLFDLIHSLDSVHLAQVLDRQGEKQGKVVPVLVEVNLAREESKSGVAAEELEGLLLAISSLQHLEVQGLMAIPPFCEKPESVRPYFRRLRTLAEEVSRLRIPNVRMEHLSMGMSHDFEIAIEEGATMVRVGTAIFGPRG